METPSWIIWRAKSGERTKLLRVRGRGARARGVFKKIARSEVQMETGDEFLNLNLKIGARHKKDHIKISQFTKFEVVSLDCNHVEGFQKSEKFVWNWGRPLTAHSLVTM